ncbi:hypothetical protein [Clostridium sp.]|uniref:hypothetical protein n=1 Tax=Clostridium sp. TaxID=1506 RepID=UPI003463E7E6
MNIVKEELIEEDDIQFIIVTYDNGTVVKYLASNGSIEEKPIVMPPSPLEILKDENKKLKEELEKQNKAIAELTMLMSTPTV